MGNRYRCGSRARREAVREKGVLNGIDYVEVSPTQTSLTVVFLQPLPGQAGGVPAAGTPLTRRNFRIDGGARVTAIAVVDVQPDAPDRAQLTVDRLGDFSTYTLRLVASPSADEPPPGYDARLAEIPFSFKVDCPSDFDCEPVEDCPTPPGEEPLLDYLARDYGSFRRLMLDRMSVTMPDFRERNPADLEVTVVELLAYVGDQLSYAQDSVATEAYLGTARRRASVRRHARLLDYAMHDGCSARTFVCLEVTPGSSADGQELRAGTPFLDATDGEGARLGEAQYLGLPPTDRIVFESLHPVRLLGDRNAIAIHTWSETDCSLPAGATGATLARPPGAPPLEVGDLLVLEEVVDPVTGQPGNADPEHRWPVRLTSVTSAHDDHEDVDVLEVGWAPVDALPFALCLARTFDDTPRRDLGVARANVVLCDHGRSLPPAALVPPGPPPGAGARYRPQLPAADVSLTVPYCDEVERRRPAVAALRLDPHDAVPSVALTAGADAWEPEPDLLNAGPFERAFVVEVEPGRPATVRFGDGVNGLRPASGTELGVRMRTGSGQAGNVGHDTIVRVVSELDGIGRVWNPLPGTGGQAPESIEQVRRYAPSAFRTQERAVTEADFAAIVERHPEVQRARASFRWTGSWFTAFVVVDRVGGRLLRDDPAFRTELEAYLDRYRMAGQDVELRDPVRVPVDLELWVCVADGYFRSDVLARLLAAFGSHDIPGGRRGFFHPDNLSFGRSIYASELLATALAQAGVADARVVRLQRERSAATDELAKGRLRIGAAEIPQLDNDPSFPENGRLVLDLDGGL